MFEYSDFLSQCPEFSTVVKLQASKSTRSGFDFGIYSSFKAVNFSPPVPQDTSSLKSVLDDESYVFDIDLPQPDTVIHTTDAASISVPTDNSGSKLAQSNPIKPSMTNA